jgi:hypothetical protein
MITPMFCPGRRPATLHTTFGHAARLEVVASEGLLTRQAEQLPKFDGEVGRLGSIDQPPERVSGVELDGRGIRRPSIRRRIFVTQRVIRAANICRMLAHAVPLYPSTRLGHS